MVDNAFVTQGLYVGLEATPGTAVPTTKRLIGGSITSKIDATAQEFRPMGSKFVTIDALQAEWTTGTLGGAACYTELPYWLGMCIGQQAAPVQQMDGGTPTGAWKWIYESKAFDADTPQTFTIEEGSTVRARRFSSSVLTDYSLSLLRTAVTQSGTLLAQQHQDNVALTTYGAAASPVQAALTTAATGGTLAAGTYRYVVTATNAVGETTASNEQTVTTTGAVSTVTATWAAVTGATGYRVYRTVAGGAAGAESILPSGTLGAVTTFIDTGATVTPGTPAAVNNAYSTPAGTLPSVPLIPILANQVDVFVDPTFAALGTTRQSRIFKVDPNFGGRYKPVWPLDSSKPSWAAIVEGPNTATCNFTAAYDPQGAAYLAQLRAGNTGYMRVRAIGPNIYTGGISVNHSATFDMAFKIKQTDAFSDTDGVFAIGYGADIVYDGLWGKAMRCEIVTTTAAL